VVTPDAKLNSSQSFVLSAALAFINDSAVPANASSLSSSDSRVELRFDLFDKTTNVSVGNLTAFAITPAFAKLTVGLFEWPWRSATPSDSRLEVRLGISPIVESVVRLEDGEESVTTFVVRSSSATPHTADDDEMRIRLIDVVEMDGKYARSVPAQSATSGHDASTAAVTFDVDVQRSELVLSFARFNSTLNYDPGSNSSSSTQSLGVSV
jgi:hypothetical protein